jgi:hypothetical protein
MKKLPLVLMFAAVFALLLFSHCSEEEKLPQIGFQNTTSAVTEGGIAVVSFSMALPSGVTPVLSLSGTATQNADYSYSISANAITITVKEDDVYDPNETIIVTLTGFDGKAEVSAQSVHTITITDIDENKAPGLQIDLSWNAGSGTPGNVDMDLILWIEFPAGSGEFFFADLSANIGTTFEQVFLPSNDVDYIDGIYGLSYIYYEGTSNNLAFKADFRVYKGSINNTTNKTSFNGVYTLANINPWDETEEFHLAQVFRKTGPNFSDFTPIDVPASGSRYKKLQAKLKEFSETRRMQRGN